MALFRKVTNAPELRQRLIAQDQSLSYALIDASLILNPFHALLAVNRAVHDEQNNQLKSHNINSEIVIELSPNYNVWAWRKTRDSTFFDNDDEISHICVYI